MSAFGIGTNDNAIESGELCGRQINIACKAWFTSQGSAKPLSFKFQGDDGMMQTVGDLCVICSEDKCYSGIPSREYRCKAVMGGLLHEFKLIFYLEESRWVMVVPQ